MWKHVLHAWRPAVCPSVLPFVMHSLDHHSRPCLQQMRNQKSVRMKKVTDISQCHIRPFGEWRQVRVCVHYMKRSRKYFNTKCNLSISDKILICIHTYHCSLKSTHTGWRSTSCIPTQPHIHTYVASDKQTQCGLNCVSFENCLF